MEENVYTEGLCGDGAAILENGKPITVSEILERLNRIEEIRAIVTSFSAVRKPMSYTEMIDYLLDALERVSGGTNDCN